MLRFSIWMLALGLVWVWAQTLLEATPWRVGLGEHKPPLIRLDQLKPVLQAQGISIEQIPVDHFPSLEVTLPGGWLLYSQRIGYGNREFVAFADLVISASEQGYEGRLEGWNPIRLVVGKLELNITRIDPYVAYAYLVSKSILGKTEYQLPFNPAPPRRCLHTFKTSEPPATVFALLTRKGYQQTEPPEFEGEAFDLAAVERSGLLHLRLIEPEVRLAASLDELKRGSADAALIRLGKHFSSRGIAFEVVKIAEFSKATVCR